MRYYEPSKDEIKIIEQITKQMEKIAEKKFFLKEPVIRFPYEDGIPHMLLHENKEIAMVLQSLGSNDVHVRVMVRNGLLIYYKYKKEKTYIISPEEAATRPPVKIQKGQWKSYEDPEPCIISETTKPVNSIDTDLDWNPFKKIDPEDNILTKRKTTPKNNRNNDDDYLYYYYYYDEDGYSEGEGYCDEDHWT